MPSFKNEDIIKSYGHWFHLVCCFEHRQEIKLETKELPRRIIFVSTIVLGLFVVASVSASMSH